VFALVRNNVRVLGLGHAHRSHKEIFDPGTPHNPNDDVIICNAGAYLRNYCRVDLLYRNKKLLHRSVDVIALSVSDEQKTKHADIQKVIDQAHSEVDDYALTYLTTMPKDMSRKDDVLGTFIVKSWLQHFPKVDIAITNRGAVRQDLHHGEVRVRDVISILPFENTLIVVTINGSQLKEVLLKNESIAVGAMYQIEEDENGTKKINQLLDRSGNPIADDQKVKLVINEFMYRGGDGYPFSEMDPKPELTAINWRTPVIEALKILNK
jgi:2',3'-cyclic-nucleotide 2'-phosphodiesterase / 3'-nucleotidase / 5'-nucleotidase